MGTVLQYDAVVGPNGIIEVRVPELAPGQRVRLSIEPNETIRGGHAIELLEQVAGHRLLKSAVEVETYIRAEREAWDRI